MKKSRKITASASGTEGCVLAIVFAIVMIAAVLAGYAIAALILWWIVGQLAGAGVVGFALTYKHAFLVVVGISLVGSLMNAGVARRD